MTRASPLGERAIRMSRPPGVSPAVLVSHIREWPAVVDVVVTTGDIAVYFEGVPDVDDERIARLDRLESGIDPGRLVEIPAEYDGPDLQAVATGSGLSARDVVRLHVEAVYTVDSIGFAPGFAYLVGVDPRLHVPRRDTPRPRVPAGSIGLAGGFTGVYPFDSPGGWHLIGRARVRMFTPEGARLRLGDRVRFVP